VVVRLSAGDVSDKESPPAGMPASPNLDDADTGGRLAEASDEHWTANALSSMPDEPTANDGYGSCGEDEQAQGSAGGGGEEEPTGSGEAALREVERAALRIQPAQTLHRSLPLATVLAFLDGCASAELPEDQPTSDAPAPPFERGTSCHGGGAGFSRSDD
jgi:hypothetical protein